MNEVYRTYFETPPARSALGASGLALDARVEIEELEEIIGKFATEEEHEEIDTLGGVVFKLIDRVPRRHEIVAHPSGLEFEIVDADPRRVKRICVRDRRPSNEE